MGLDMYLNRRPKSKKAKILSKLNNEEEEGEELYYWRKANAIHGWFVNNCGKGIDKCQKIKVSEKQLKMLLTIIQIVLNSKTPEMAEKYLPTREGFFFGGTQYDDYYWEELQNTSDAFQTILKETDFKNEELIYQASW